MQLAHSLSTGAVILIISRMLDGVSESISDDVAVQRVERRMVDGAEESNYTWCNTNNHRDTNTYTRLQETGENWYAKILQETSMQKWAGVLGSLCGDRLLGGHVLTITTEQQRKYFKPASQLAMAGARASRLLRDEAEDLAAELCACCKVSIDPPFGGWFVRTSACSPKDACHDGGGGPHHSLTEVVLALLASERIQRSMKDYDSDQLVYLMPFDATVTTERELRVFVHNRRVTQYHSMIVSMSLVYLRIWKMHNWGRLRAGLTRSIASTCHPSGNRLVVSVPTSWMSST